MIKTVHRIMQLIKHLNLSARQFDLSINAGNGYTLRMYKNNASVGSDVIERIKEIYPQVNLVWLITGEGEMLLKEPPKPSILDIDAYISERLNHKLSTEKKALLQEIIEEINKLY